MARQTPSFRARDAIAVQEETRRLLGLPAETFSLPGFIGMVSDEVEQLRAAGWSDERIAELIRMNTRQDVSAADIAEHYASPEARGH